MAFNYQSSFDRSSADVHQKILNFIFEQANLWLNKIITKFQYHVKKYLYAPGMSGYSRCSERFDLEQNKIPSFGLKYTLDELKDYSHILVNRMSKKEICEILEKYGLSHHISL